ncbi:Ycf51 family protein [Romeria aff. gracilis LEGE 07310]|uniref:Ycf51 family protein n=1 Tax=Vasconcelosia minhoensis LEGE 07310 TaxID=915328 RepID=A0A8J7AUC1_9CYAN|nr:Ycf51 family protein [Romeria gracilis]MBE9076818.1 Ycf51 family protein [Romeria aff. gracilis LEGE 07310]
MLTPADFLQATQWVGLGTLAFAGLTLLAFILKWGWRFRLVGATGLMAVLTVGLFGLSFEPFTRAAVPGSVPFTTVFDSGGSQIVIKVPQSITQTELEATLQQAASNLLKASRLGNRQTPTIRARTIVHPRPGISELLYVGQVQPIPDAETGEPVTIQINAPQLAKASAASAA